MKQVRLKKLINNKKSIITTNILDFIKELLKNNNTITLGKIKKKINQKFKIDISISYIYYIIKYKLNIIYKQLRKKYYRIKNLLTLKKDKYEYYKEFKKIGKDNIISIDETGFYLNMKKSNARCQKGSDVMTQHILIHLLNLILFVPFLMVKS